MTTRIDSEIARFYGAPERLRSWGYEVRELCEGAFEVFPSGDSGPSAEALSDRIGLTLMGLTHGNEVVGVSVLNDLVDLLVLGVVRPSVSLALILGNTAAARSAIRFLEKDLNRSFAKSSVHGLEERRARELEAVLGRSAFFIDFHQITEKSDRGFFIFPHTKPSYAFARAILPELPIVTHWGDAFSAEGCCSDEYVNEQGGVGITIELGQAGFDPYQSALGLQSCIAALAYVGDRSKVGQPVSSAPSKGEIFTWAATIPFPAEAGALDPGWYNFKPVVAGQRLGVFGGREITAPVAGRMLFPKYLRGPIGEDPTKPRPTELCRIMRTVAEEELP